MQLETDKQGYNSHVSVMKGIAMLAVVWCHSTRFTEIPILTRFPSIVALTLFVIVSGYCFNDYYLTHKLTFVKKRIKSLYLPFVVWSIIFLLLHNTLWHLGFYPTGTPLYSWHDILSEIPNVLMLRSPDSMVGAIWFIVELFFSALIFILFSDWIKSHPLAWAAGFVVVAVVMNVTGFHFRLRDVSLMCAAYYTLGYWVRGRCLPHQWWVIALLLLSYAIGSLFVHGNFQKMNAPWIVPYIVIAIAGAWAVAAIAWHIDNHNNRLKYTLAYIGDHSLIILTLHFTAMHTVSWILVHAMGLPTEYVSHHPVIKALPQAWLLYLVAGILLPLAFDFIYQKLKKKIFDL